MDINIRPTYPEIFCKYFFLEKIWLRNALPTYNLDIYPKFRSFFPSESSPNSRKHNYPPTLYFSDNLKLEVVQDIYQVSESFG